MKKSLLSLCTILGLAFWVSVQAFAAPSLPDLAASGTAVSEGGKISLGMFSSRDGFGKNKLKQLVPAEKADKDKEGNAVFAKGTSSFAVSKDNLTLKTFGRTSGEERYEWAPIVLFEPKAPGLYAISGTLAFNDSLAGKNVRWVLFRILPDNRFEVILEGRAANKTVINLSRVLTSRPSRSIRLTHKPLELTNENTITRESIMIRWSSSTEPKANPPTQEL